MEALAEIAKLRTNAEDARREYEAKSTAAKAAAERVPQQLQDALDTNHTKAKWEDALQARQAASEAAATLRKRATEWLEGAKKKYAELETAAAGKVSGEAGKELQAELAEATKVLAMGAKDVVSEKQEEVLLLQKVCADAVRENESKKRGDLQEYIKTIQVALEGKTKEVSELLKAVAVESVKKVQDLSSDEVKKSSLMEGVSNLLGGANPMESLKKLF